MDNQIRRIIYSNIKIEKTVISICIFLMLLVIFFEFFHPKWHMGIIITISVVQILGFLYLFRIHHQFIQILNSFQIFINHLDVGLIFRDEKNGFFFASPKLKEILELPDEPFDDTDIDKILGRTPKNSEKEILEINYPHTAETSKCLLFSKAPVFENKTPRGYISIITDITELRKSREAQKEAEKKSKESANLFKGLIHHMEEGLVITDENFSVLFVNRKVLDITGYQEQELLDIEFANILTEESLVRVSQRILERGQGDAASTEPIDVDIIKKDGTIINLVVSNKSIAVNENTIQNLAVLSDVSSLKETEQALKESDEQSKTILETIDEGVIIVNKNFKVQYFNSKFGEWIEESGKEKLKKGKEKNFFTEESWKTILEMIDENSLKGKPCRFLIQAYSKEGVIKDMLFSGNSIMKEGKFEKGIVTLTDISPLIEAEKALKESETKYRLLVENSPDMIGIFKKGLITYMNSAGLSMLKATHLKQVIGKPILDFIAPDNRDKIQASIDKILHNKTPSGLSEEIIMTIDNHIVDADVSAIPFFDHEEIYIQFTARDISKRIKAQQELKEYQESLEEKIDERTIEMKKARDEAEAANQMKSEFLANISHELRTPMHAILSYSKFGYKKFDIRSKEKLIDYFHNIHLSGKRLLNLLNDLLDLSRLQANKMYYDKSEWIIQSVFDYVREEFSVLLEEKGLELKIQEREPIPLVFDMQKVRQVISNLIDNAIKYSHPNTRIKVSFDDLTDRVIFNVSNIGVPIPEDEKEAIFDPFIQSSKTKTGAGGTGLGLSICKNIVENHEGEIWAEPNKEGGCFKFYLPKNQAVSQT